MIERILKHIEERDALVKEIAALIGYCDDSPININLTSKWEIVDEELHIAVDNEPLDEDYYGYTISSHGAKGEELFMGTTDGYTYVMAHPDNWSDTTIFVLDNKNKN